MSATRAIPALLLAALALASCEVILHRGDGTQTVHGRAQHSAFWTGKEMLVGGGRSSGGDRSTANCDDGCDEWSLYDPATDRWRGTGQRITGGRERHAGVWTGSEMIVWGGQVGLRSGPGSYEQQFEVSASGLRYEPASDSWRSTSGLGAPLPRIEHSAVWTGSEMIVWGGKASQQAMSAFADGGRYDPRSDTWKPVATTGAPGPRARHGAVWTGSEMIVWGGADPAGSTPAGGRYNPVTDTWASVSTTGKPDPRDYPTVVWTGSEMIVAAGFPTEGPALTVAAARYVPATDSWHAIAAPRDATKVTSMSYLAAAAWTGKELVLWQSLGGERYLPASDRWETLVPKGERVVAPPLMSGMSAVWTGAEVIIWGGETTANQGMPRTGLRYDPRANSWRATSVVEPAVH